MKLSLLAAVASAALTVPRFAHAATCAIDPVRSEVGLWGEHRIISGVNVTFSTFPGTLDVDAAAVTKASVRATMDAASIGTRTADRDGHLESPALLDVAHGPTLAFTSKTFTGSGGTYPMTADRTIRGVTREVVGDGVGLIRQSKDAGGNLRAGATGTTTIHRKDFGLARREAIETGGVGVGEDVAITPSTKLIPKALGSK